MGSTRHAEKLPMLASAGISGVVLDLDPEPASDVDERFFDCDLFVLNIPPGRREDVEHWHPTQIEAVAARLSDRCREVLYVSSTSVYPARSQTVDEAFVGEPEKLSGRALLKAESLLQATDGFRTTVLRMAGLIGPGRMPGNFLSGKTSVKMGDCPVNLLHQADAIEACRRVIHGDVWGEVFNVVGDEHPTRREYYTAAATALGVPLPTFADDGEAPWKIVDNAKIKRVLGMEFRGLDAEA